MTLLPQLSDFVSTKKLRYPAVLGQDSKSESTLKLLLTSEDLAGVSKNHSGFLSLLLERAEKEGVDLQK